MKLTLPKEEKISRARKICLTKATEMKTSHADWASIEQGRNSKSGEDFNNI